MYDMYVLSSLISSVESFLRIRADASSPMASSAIAAFWGPFSLFALFGRAMFLNLVLQPLSYYFRCLIGIVLYQGRRLLSDRDLVHWFIQKQSRYLFVNRGAGRSRKLSDFVGHLAEFSHERPYHEEKYQRAQTDIEKQPLPAFEKLEIFVLGLDHFGAAHIGDERNIGNRYLVPPRLIVPNRFFDQLFQ